MIWDSGNSPTVEYDHFGKQFGFTYWFLNIYPSETFVFMALETNIRIFKILFIIAKNANNLNVQQL